MQASTRLTYGGEVCGIAIGNYSMEEFLWEVNEVRGTDSIHLINIHICGKALRSLHSNGAEHLKCYQSLEVVEGPDECGIR